MPYLCVIGGAAPKDGAIVSDLEMDMELAIALTNANINSGRVVVSRPSSVGHDRTMVGGSGGHMSSSTRSPESCSVPVDICRRGLCRLTPLFCKHRASKRHPEARVVWSRPLEIVAGPGYSPASGKRDVPKSRASWHPVISAIPDMQLAHLDQISDSKVSKDKACELVIGRTTKKTSGRIRVDLYTRLGLLNAHRPESWPRSIPQHDPAIRAGLECDQEGSEQNTQISSLMEAAAREKRGRDAIMVEGCGSMSDSTLSACSTPVTSCTGVSTSPPKLSLSGPACMLEPHCTQTLVRDPGSLQAGAGALASVSPAKRDGFFHVAGGYF